MNEKTISEFLNNEYKEFAMYVIENRAIPSVIDSFKSSHRKIIHVSNQIWKTGSEKHLKVFQLVGKIASDCLHYDSEVLLSNGDKIKIGEWFDNYPDVELEVLSIDENGEIVTNRGYNPKCSLQKYVYEIETEDGKIHKMSGNHQVMLIDGTYKKASDLTIEDEIKSIDLLKNIKNINKIVLEKPEYYYDISVDNHHNFIINDSIVVHNCFYHHGDCLEPDTQIVRSDNSIITIGEWFEKYPNEKFELISYDEETKSFTTGIGHSPRIGSITDIEYEIKMEDDSQFKCTRNHPFLTQRGWKIAEDLLETDSIKNINGYLKIQKIYKNILEEPEKFYDITVEKYHNFVIGEKAKIVTHNSSLSGAVINMAQRFKNNAPLLEEDGQFGSLRSPQASAPRYIGTRLSPNFRLIYKDFELLKYKEEEGESIEPEYFLPIIPMVLVNGSSGVAVGFATNILNRDVKPIIDCCIKILNGKEISIVKPSSNEFNGEYIQDPENHKRWIIRGVVNKVNTSTVRITELPPSMTYEKYEEILDKLVDDKLIVSYDDNCKDNIDYTIKFNRSALDKLDQPKLIKLLKLEEYSTENFSTLDQYGKLKIFNSFEEIVHYFVDFRLSYYDKRKQFLLNKLNKELKVLSNRGRFIKAILDEKLKINNVVKSEIINQIETMNLDKIDDSYDYLLRMPIYSLTRELFEKLKEDFTNKKLEIVEVEAKEVKEMYLDDLTELKKKFK